MRRCGRRDPTSRSSCSSRRANSCGCAMRWSLTMSSTSAPTIRRTRPHKAGSPEMCVVPQTREFRELVFVLVEHFVHLFLHRSEEALDQVRRFRHHLLAGRNVHVGTTVSDDAFPPAGSGISRGTADVSSRGRGRRRRCPRGRRAAGGGCRGFRAQSSWCRWSSRTRRGG